MGFVKQEFNYELVVNKDNALVDIRLNGESLKYDPSWMTAYKAMPEFQVFNKNEGNFGTLTVSFYADDIRVVNEDTKED